MKDRILQLLESEKLSSAEFADKIGVQRSNVSHVLSGRNQPGFSFIQKLLEAFPLVNSRWLITGGETMYESLKEKQKKELLNSQPTIIVASKEGRREEPPSAHVPEQEVNTVLNEISRLKEETHQTVNSSKPENLSTANSPKRKALRVIIFFENHTFEDYYPAE